LRNAPAAAKNKLRQVLKGAGHDLQPELAGGTRGAGTKTADEATGRARPLETRTKGRGGGKGNQSPNPQGQAPQPQAQPPAPGGTQALTPAQAKALGGKNRGVIFVQENLGTPRNPAQRTARDFESGTTGAFSDTPSQQRAVPALRYDNPNPKGNNFVKFDGIEGNTLIDSKTKILVIRRSDGTEFIPQADDIRRVSRAAAQNPQFNVVYEFPTVGAQREAIDVLQRLGIQNIRTRVRQ
jgi:filamentous hemagglutinin